METNIVVDISPPIPYLVKFCFSNYGPKCCQPMKLQDSLKCSISRKVNNEVYFWHADKHRSPFFKLILKYPKIRNLHIFAVSPEKHWARVDFLPANKRKSFSQVDSITMGLPKVMHAQSTTSSKFTISL